MLAAIWESEATEEQMTAKMKAAHTELRPKNIPVKKKMEANQEVETKIDTAINTVQGRMETMI
jgi:hypothetical protein